MKIVSWAKKIKNPYLVAEVKKRQLPIKLLELYTPQVLLLDGVEKYCGFAMENDLKGFQIWSEGFKGYIGPKAITTYPATAKQWTSYIFPDQWDFLAWVSIMGHQPDQEMIIHHGLVDQCAAHILSKGMEKVFSFRHMDDRGLEQDGELALKLEAAVTYGTMEANYDGFDSLSSKYMDNPQAIRTALKIGTVPKVYYDPLVKRQGQPKYSL